MKKVACYIRVSTLEQAQSGYSIGEQKERLTKFCEANGWHVVDYYIDAGHSGATLDRPELQRLISDIGRYDTVAVLKIDRMSRNQKNFLYLIEDVFKKNGVAFVSMSEQIDSGTPMGNMMISIISSFAQLEREMITERMQIGKEGRAKSGKAMAWAKVPFGYRYDKDKSQLIIEPIQAGIVRQIFTDYLAGISITKLRDKLNEAGHIGKPIPWSYRTIRQTLDNPTYYGVQRFKGEIYPGSHDAIISRETFEAVQKELTTRQQQAYAANNNPRPFQAKYMLSGIGRCGYCGAPLAIQIGHRTNGEKTYRYQCANRHIKRTKPATIYNDGKKCDSGFYYMEDIERHVIEEISKLKHDESYLQSILGAPTEKDLSSIRAELKAITGRLKRLNDLYLNDMIDMDELKTKSGDLMKQKKTLEAELNQGPNKEAAAKISDALATDIKALDYENQKIIVNTLIEKVDVTAKTIKIHWKI